MNLGYDFAWHDSGAYSSRLTDDLYDLAAGPSTTLPYALNVDFTQRVQHIRSILHVPNGILLDDSRWLLLLAATRYLMKHTSMPNSQVETWLAKVDAAIPPYRDKAAVVLSAA